VEKPYNNDFIDGISYAENLSLAKGKISHDEIIVLANHMYKKYPKLCEILNDRYDFAFPPKDLNSEITAYAVQRTYYVDDNGNDEYDGGSPEKAFATLQKAAEAIKKNGGAYNFVSVAPGVY
jgi:hypothetical protein